MRVLLDQEVCDIAAETVGQAIDAAAELARHRGRMIVEVTVDDAKMSPETMEQPGRLDSDAEVVELVSAVPGAVVANAFADAADALTDADDLQREAAELLQSDEPAVSMDKLGEAIAIWQAVQEAVTMGARLLGLDLDTFEIDGGTMPAAIRRLNDGLQVIRSALSDGDQIGLADTLLYEFPEVSKEWRGILAGLTRYAEAEATRGAQ